METEIVTSQCEEGNHKLCAGYYASKQNCRIICECSCHKKPLNRDEQIERLWLWAGWTFRETSRLPLKPLKLWCDPDGVWEGYELPDLTWEEIEMWFVPKLGGWYARHDAGEDFTTVFLFTADEDDKVVSARESSLVLSFTTALLKLVEAEEKNAKP